MSRFFVLNDDFDPLLFSKFFNDRLHGLSPQWHISSKMKPNPPLFHFL